MKRVSIPLGVFSALVYLFVYTPLAVVVLFSFNAARHGQRWEGFTFGWYRTLAANRQVLEAGENSLIVAVTSTLIATVLGTFLAVGLARQPFPGRGFFERLLYVPVFIPDIVLAAALLLFYAVMRRWLGVFELGYATLITAHVTFQLPFVAIVVRARLSGMDPSLEEAARDLGANRWRTFWHVTLPLLLPGVLAGAILAFTLSLDDFVVSFFTCGPGSTTLPIHIYSSVKRGITPDINALSAILVGVSALAALGVAMLQSRRISRQLKVASPETDRPFPPQETRTKLPGV